MPYSEIMLLNLQKLPCFLPLCFGATLVLNVTWKLLVSAVTLEQSQSNALGQ